MQKINITILREEFQRINNSPIKTQIKLALLRTIMEQLRHALQNKDRNSSCLIAKEELADTAAFSHLSLVSNSNDVLGSLCEGPFENTQVLQKKIIKKQKEKMELNEQIETLQQDFFQRQRVLLSRRELCDSLDSRIAEETFRINRQVSFGYKADKVEEGGFSDRLRHFFSF